MNLTTKHLAALCLPIFFLVACNNGDDNSKGSSNNNGQYRITIMNGSANQMLSPGILFVNDKSLKLWSVGKPASLPLEMLAESGSPTALAAANSTLFKQPIEAILPGSKAMLDVDVSVGGSLYLSYASMPVYTNDGFAGLQNIIIDDLEIGNAMMMELPIYDAGTENNDEALSSIPGPAIGGQGFSEIRDDIHNFVTMHPGIVSQDGGLTGSTLNESYRFDKGTFQVQIVRMQ